MALAAGTRIGVYEIQASLGAGGMGEVYRARDGRLNRDVAIKILPDEFKADADRLTRFEREAQMLAALNHPHIAAIYGFEQQPPSLVLELVEGVTLADRLRSGPMSADEATGVARQIADAIDAAHERGIVHRDLKPANIKITPDGVVKVLDFGLAKAVSPGLESAIADDLAKSPTVTVGGTRDGVILGTAAYMSPEQARGKRVDKRTDIWAFGCVLFEMLTARRAFSGETTSDTIAAILERVPDWTALPATTPPVLTAVVRRCLEKDPKGRLRDIGEVSHLLDQPAAADAAAAVLRPRRLGPALGASAITASLAMLLWLMLRPAPLALTPSVFAITAPDDWAIDVAPPVPSPDGSRIAFVAEDAAGKSSIWIRQLDSTVPVRLAGTEGATGLTFWSPDSRYVGFFADQKLKRIEASGGQPVNICSMLSNLGATWGDGDIIVLAPVNRTSLFRVSAAGGTPEPITTLEASRENSHRWPHFLPDGRHFLFTARSDVKQNNLIYVGSLDSKEIKPLRAAQSNALYIAPGYLLFADDGALRAQRFDARTLALTGEPTVVTASVRHNTPSSNAFFAASPDGSVIAFLPALRVASRLLWLDRTGRSLGPIGPEQNFAEVRLAPSGRMAAVNIPDPDSGTRDIWIVNMESGALTRLTSNPATDWIPVWSPDSDEVAFASDRNGASSIYRKPVDGSAAEELLLRAAQGIFPRDWLSDGRSLVYNVDNSSGGTGDLLLLSLTGERKSTPLVQTGFQQMAARGSPDGKWLAYDSRESGTAEVYLRSFAGPGRIRVSTGGGYQPSWRRDGRELYYLGGGGEMMAVPIADGPTPVGLPVSLFTGCGATTARALSISGYGTYDVSADGTKFLMVCLPPETTPSAIHVSLNWSASAAK